MKNFNLVKFFGLLIFIFIFYNCEQNENIRTNLNKVKLAGNTINGIREIILDPKKDNVTLNIYRGDYVIFKTLDNRKYLFQIPSLKIDTNIQQFSNSKSYIKFPDSGTFNFWLDKMKGKIIVHEYDIPNYKEVNALKAFDIIKNINPIILDVRTVHEYKNGHLKNSLLIPVQEIQTRYSELEKYKNSAIFIYCASGNRSTVASRILIEKGYKIIYNLRYGISDWVQKGYPVEK